MAVGVIMQFDGGTLDQYDEVIRRMGLTPGGAVADGGMFHWVSATAGGIRVIDVWESRERFEEFAATQIGPITAEVGVAGPPRTEIVPVHNFFTGNASQAAPAPVGVIVEWDGATLGQYDAAIAHAGMAPGAAGAAGCLFHWVGATASGIRVIDVWESRESFERFAAETIMPATAAAGVGGQPRI